METAIIHNDLEFVTNFLKNYTGGPLDALLFTAIDYGRSNMIDILWPYCTHELDYIYYASKRGQVHCLLQLLLNKRNINRNPLLRTN
jgi:hypothetical protein